MSFLPLHRDKEHKFKNGHWAWTEQENSKLTFHSNARDKETKPQFNSFNAGLKFSDHIDVAGEKIFREIFQRPNSLYDSDVVTLQDVKNLVLFLLKSKVPRKFIEFVNSTTFDRFLHSIMLYMDLFLQILELLLIRRDEESGGKTRDTYSLKVEQLLAKRLSDRRLLVAREYSKVFHTVVPL
jgi:Protein phosphatase 1 inhibitor